MGQIIVGFEGVLTRPDLCPHRISGSEGGVGDQLRGWCFIQVGMMGPGWLVVMELVRRGQILCELCSVVTVFMEGFEGRVR